MTNGAQRITDAWTLDPAITFLNHGSFGACPRIVMEAARRYQEELEREPVRFFRELEPRVDAVRREVAAFVGAPEAGLVFVTNATTGVNAVLRSLDFAPGDELLTTDHAYNACKNTLDYVAKRAGAVVVVAAVPFPLASADLVTRAVVDRVTPRTRIALLDHVTSPTGLVFPIAAMARELEARGVDVLVDGAHAPGMLPLDIASLGVAYYTGNLHKWVCAPKGIGFLYVREDKTGLIHPTVMSHGANAPRADKSRFLLEFDWTGTSDPSALLAVPDALRFMGGILPGGFTELMVANRVKALAARDLLCTALSVEPPAPDSMIGALAAVPLPKSSGAPKPPLYLDPMQETLFDRYRFEVPIVPFPRWPERLVRVSAQAYNDSTDYARLASTLREIIATEK